jgi:hypothetical protein
VITITVLGLEDALCRDVLHRVAAVVVESGVSAVVETHTDFEQMIAREPTFLPPFSLTGSSCRSAGCRGDQSCAIGCQPFRYGKNSAIFQVRTDKKRLESVAQQ